MRIAIMGLIVAIPMLVEIPVIGMVLSKRPARGIG